MTDREILERARNYVGIRYVNGVEDAYITPILEKAIKAGAEALKERAERKSPCDLCAYNPPSSCDGKPCTMCPACAKDDAE